MKLDFKPFQPPPDFRAFIAVDASPSTIKKVMTMYTHPSTSPGEKANAASILQAMGVPLPEPSSPQQKFKVTPEWWAKQEQESKPQSYTYSATWLPKKTQWMIRRSDGRVAYISSVYAATKELALNLASKPGINWY